MIFSSLSERLKSKMTRLPLPLQTFKGSEAFWGLLLPYSSFGFADFCVQLHQV